MNGPVRLVVSHLTKRFGGLIAVKDLRFGIRAGEILGLIGPNGSGKSTVIKLIMGIERPDAGTIHLDGVDITRWPSHRISRAGVGIMFQRSRPLRRRTVVENVKLALLPDSLQQVVADPSVDARARQIAERVGLSGVIQQHPSAFILLRPSPVGDCEGNCRPPKIGAARRTVCRSHPRRSGVPLGVDLRPP